MSKKLKSNVRLNDGEAYVVGSIEFWNHIAFTYRSLAEQFETEEDRIAWESVAEYIDGWVSESAYVSSLEDDGWK
jgi:hypothetical protein